MQVEEEIIYGKCLSITGVGPLIIIHRRQCDRRLQYMVRWLRFSLAPNPPFPEPINNILGSGDHLQIDKMVINLKLTTRNLPPDTILNHPLPSHNILYCTVYSMYLPLLPSLLYHPILIHISLLTAIPPYTQPYIVVTFLALPP